MPVERVVPNLPADDAGAGRAFFTGVLGMTVAMEHDFITTYRGADAAQISVLAQDPSGFRPDYSVEVSDVDACHARAVAAGAQVVYGPADEPWRVRRFFVRDPLGRLANILQHA